MSRYINKVRNNEEEMMNMMGFGWGMMGLLGLIPLLIIGLIVYAVIALTQNKYSNKREHDEALDILNQKFASGEISEEEYTRKKKIIKG